MNEQELDSWRPGADGAYDGDQSGDLDPLDALEDGSSLVGTTVVGNSVVDNSVVDNPVVDNPVVDDSVGGSRSSGALPFVVSAREEFAALGDLPVTGDARVDAATARLEEVSDLPTADHIAVYDDVHQRLQDALGDADVR